MTANFEISTSTTLTHTIVLTAPENQPFVGLLNADGYGGRVVFETLIVTVTAESDGTVLPLQTTYIAPEALALDADGHPTRSRRKFVGGNLNRLPGFLREAIEEAAWDLGVRGLAEDAEKFFRTKGHQASRDVSQEIVPGTKT